MTTIMTTFDKCEARIVLKQLPGEIDVKVEGAKSANPLVKEHVEKLLLLALNLEGQKDLFTCSNDPAFDAGILIRQCNELVEVTPYYTRDLPNHPPYSPAELMAGKLLTRFVEC